MFLNDRPGRDPRVVSLKNQSSLISGAKSRVCAVRLASGGLVAFPTETVYGLGVDAENEPAVARMYEVKGRPANHPVIIHISNQNLVSYWAEEIPEYAIALMRKFWPGPMTLILKRSKNAKARL